MLFTSSISVLSALLAGQIAIAAYVPLRPRAEIVRTEVRTVYSTKIVFATPYAAGTNSTDGLPLAPSISRLSIPLGSIIGVNPINGLPVPTVKKSTTKKPVSTKKPMLTKKPAPAAKPISSKRPAVNSSAVAGIASILAQQPQQSSTKAAAAGIASLLAHVPKVSKPSSAKPAAGIVIVPVTLKTTQKPKTTTITKQPASQTDGSASSDSKSKAKSLLAMLSAAQN